MDYIAKVYIVVSGLLLCAVVLAACGFMLRQIWLDLKSMVEWGILHYKMRKLENVKYVCQASADGHEKANR